MNIPFSLNFFKRVEMYQTIKQLNEQFDEMFEEWKTRDNKEPDGYPLWEIEKKVLIWTARYHKHLGSPIQYIEHKDMLIGITGNESIQAGKDGGINVLKNIAVRGWGIYNDGLLINKEGLEYGLLLYSLYDDPNPERGRVKKEIIKRPKVLEFQFERNVLIEKRQVWIGYKFLYYSGLTTMFSLFFLLLSQTFSIISLPNVALLNNQVLISISNAVLAVLLFLPIMFFILGVVLIHPKR